MLWLNGDSGMPEGVGYGDKPNGTELRDVGGKWMERIRAAETRDEEWFKDAKAAENTYAAGRTDEKSTEGVPDFNILHSNVETIVPAIYNSTPVPDIRERWPVKAEQTPQQIPPQIPQQGQPPIGGQSMPQGMQQPQALPPPQELPTPYKDVAELLERAITLQIDDNKMDSEMEFAALDAFMAGRGIVRIKVEADVEDFEETRETQAPDGSIAYEEVTGQIVRNEKVKYEAVAWRDYREGPATRFENVPWIAFRHFLSDEDVKKMGGDMLASQTLDEIPTDNESKAEDVPIWEIWNKDNLEVCFIRETDGVILSKQDDPLGLNQFFPIPQPIQPVSLTNRRTPINPYVIYRKQAMELDKVTKRINAIISGLKIRGGVAGDVENIQTIADAGDNELVAIQNVEGLAQTGGLDKAIIWWPVDKAIQVLRELYIARDQIKQLIYEITGISDIVRGQSQASETATAQNIKSQWGSIRIKKMQRLIERHVRDLFVLTAEAIAKNFTIETLKEQCRMEITPEMQEILDGGVNQYHIDVESDSTVRADLSRQKGEMEGFLNGTAAFFSTMAPVVAQAPQMAGPTTDLYASFARQFNLGKQAEDAIEEMGNIAKEASKGDRPDPAAEAAKAEAAKGQAEMQMKQAELQSNQQAKQAEMQLKAQSEQASMQLKAQEAQAKAQGEQSKLQLEVQKIELQTEIAKADALLKKAQLDQQAQTSADNAQIKAAELRIKEAELELKGIDRQIATARLDFEERKAAAEITLETEQQRAVKVGE